MKLTPRSQGFRVRKPDWAPGRYLDIRRVGRFWITAINEKGGEETLPRDERENDWIKIGGTTGADEG